MLEPATASDWRPRFTAAQVGFPRWTDALPDRLAYVSTASGSWQVWLSDRGRDPVPITDATVGVEDVLVAPGGGVVWWDDGTGDERGRWIVHDPRTGATGPLVDDAPAGWSTGISFANGTVAYGVATGSDYRAFVRTGAGPSRQLAASAEPLGVGSLERLGGGLSADGRIVCLRHAEGGDIIHQSLRAVDASSGGTIAELTDPGAHLDPVAWSPVPGDPRLVVTSELGPYERPAIWDPTRDDRRDLEIDLPGAVLAIGWWPDGSAILARQEHAGQDRLLRVDPASGAATVVADTGGEIPEAAVRPDGTIWLLTSDGRRPPRVETADGDPVLEPPGPPAPPGRPLAPIWFENPRGDAVQAFVVTPPGPGPFPTVISVHGGPEWHERDRYDPETQSLVDAGYAVALVNYRGSTGYGVAFRRALIGDPWLPESEDIVSCVDAVVAAGIADPERIAFAGWSWGGCLACLNAGLHPDRWKAVFAGIPAGDSIAAHDASMPEIQAYDIAIYGGGPGELPERWRERDPMTFVDRVRAPVLIVAGEHDPRCPIEGITPWVDALRRRGIPVELHTYGGGHHANATEQKIEHMEKMLDFFARNL